MGELGSIWLYQEDGDDDLRYKLQSTRMELEEVRLEVRDAKKQTREKERQLHNLLQIACRERDEAREQLHNLLIHNEINFTTCCPEIIPSKNLLNSDESNIVLKQQQMLQFPRANSSITESNTLSDPFNSSYVSSSPVDSMFDAVTSPEFSTLNYIGGESGLNFGGYVNNHQTFVNDISSQTASTNRFDHATATINELIKGKVLPRKGKLLEAVMEAGPLLQTLMLAGPLPSWRNPPTLQPFKMSQVTATPFAEMSCGPTSQMITNSMLNFSSGNVRWVPPTMNLNNQIVVGKRQRLM